MEIGPLSNVEMNALLSSTSEVAGTNTDITFQYGDVDEIINRQNTKKGVEQSLKAYKGNIELNIPFWGDDYIIFKGDNKMTYGQLRERLGIPGGVLSETNRESLEDDDKIATDTKIYLNDIGWYEVYPEFEGEAADIRAQRRYGNHHAGYQRAVTNDDIKKWLK